MDKKILKAYVQHKTSLREVAKKCGTDHHAVKRVLNKYNIEIVAAKRKPFTKQHRAAISKACKGRAGWSKGKKMSKNSLYKNMAAHLRFSVSPEWLMQYEDIEKLKTLNRAITNRCNRWDSMTTHIYKEYIERFYNCPQFNAIYERWANSGKTKYLKPSIDHIIPKSKGGKNELSNLQFLTWFENRCKNDMTQEEWNQIKRNTGAYFV